jgi:hypothetical protein
LLKINSRIKDIIITAVWVVVTGREEGVIIRKGYTGSSYGTAIVL